MLPTDALAVLAIMSASLIIFRYTDAWLFFRSNGRWLRQLDTVPWPLRSKAPRPSPYIIFRAWIVMTKIITLLLLAPIVVCIAALVRPEWVTASDTVAAGLSGATLLGIGCLDRRVIASLRDRFNVPTCWQSLLR